MAATKSSLEAAAEAAARVNAMLIAKGKLKLPPSNVKPKPPVGPKTTGDLFTAEVEINDAPLPARNMLTRGITQDEINKYSGAAVSTRGRYMTFEDKAKNSNERPLYLHVQASSIDAVDLAVEKIHKIIEQHLKSTGSTIKWSRSATTVRSSPDISSAPPPLMSINTSNLVTGQSYVQEKVFIGLEHASIAFQVREKIVGPGESYLNHIRTETGANVHLRGKGSGYLEPTSGREAFEPLHIHLAHPKQKSLQVAKELAVNLVQTVQQEYAQWQQQQTLTMLTIQSQQPTLGTQQVALQPSIQTVGVVNAGSLGISMPQDAVALIGVPQTSVSNAQLQVGGVGPAGVATSLAALMPPLATSVSSVLASSAGASLQVVPSQILSQTANLTANTLPSIMTLTQTHPLQVSTTTTAVGVLSAAPQLVYTQTMQPHTVQTSQAIVSATQAILNTQAQIAAAAAAGQPQHQLSQVALQAQPQVQAQQQTGVTPTAFYLVSQPTVPTAGVNLAAATSSTIQMQVDAHNAQALAQQVQQQQQQQQNQNQPRVLQQIAGTGASAAYVTNYPYQVTGVPVSVGGTSSAAAVSYPHFRTQTEVVSGQKRKFQEEIQLRDGYLHTATSLRSSSQQSFMSLPTTFSASYSQPHHAMIYSSATHGLQTSTAFGSTVPSSHSSIVKKLSDHQLDRDQQLMPPPPLPVSQGLNQGRNSELERKRLKGVLWNVPNVYGSSDEDDDDPTGSLSSVNRQLQRSPTRQRKYSAYGTMAGLYSSRNDDGHLVSQASSVSNQVNYSPGNQHRYPYQSPFWMAPN